MTALALAFVAAPAHAGSLIGVQADGFSPRTPVSRIDAQVASIAAVHGKLMRLEVDWSQLEPHVQGQYDPAVVSRLDRMVNAAAARGIKVVVFVDRTPCWASSAPDRGNCAAKDANRFAVTRYPPSDPETYVPVSTFVASRYGDKLAAFEVWNEPDQRNEKYWAGPDKVKRYVALMRAVYGPLKTANPNLQVIAGSFVGVNGAWLKAMYEAGAKGYYDGLAVHFYDLPLQALKDTRKVQLAAGDHTPLWLTEFGWTSCLRKGGPTTRADHPCVTKTQQARGLGDVVKAVARTPWIAGATLYTLTDSSIDYQFGLLSAKGARKPAYSTVRSVLAHPRSGRISRSTVRLRRSGDHVVVSGVGSVADMYVMTIKVSGQLRFRATFRTSGTGSWRIAVPASIGTSHMRVRVQSRWTGWGITRTR